MELIVYKSYLGNINIVSFFVCLMEVILDTNFIISCIRKKIDFLSELEQQGFKVILPREVLQELKDLRLNVVREDKVAIDVALEIFSKRSVKKSTLGKRTVDEGLILLGKQGAYIATLDAAIKRSVPNSIGLSLAGNSILIQRS